MFLVNLVFLGSSILDDSSSCPKYKVYAQNEENQPPVIIVNYSGRLYNLKYPVVINLTKSYDPEGGEIFFFIIWGDGLTSREGDKDFINKTIFSHQYEITGDYHIMIEAKDDLGMKSYKHMNISVMIIHDSPRRDVCAMNTIVAPILILSVGTLVIFRVKKHR